MKHRTTHPATRANLPSSAEKVELLEERVEEVVEGLLEEVIGELVDELLDAVTDGSMQSTYL